MPKKLPKPCSYPGCPALTSERFCEKHKRQEQRRQDEQRGTAHERGYTARWQKARAAFLRQNPLCAECERQGRVMPASVVDHIVPHKGDPALFWDAGNWQSLCAYHHNVKTAKEDGGFGHG